MTHTVAIIVPVSQCPMDPGSTQQVPETMEEHCPWFVQAKASSGGGSDASCGAAAASTAVSPSRSCASVALEPESRTVGSSATPCSNAHALALTNTKKGRKLRFMAARQYDDDLRVEVRIDRRRVRRRRAGEFHRRKNNLRLACCRGGLGSHVP